ncbi:hypothetical protein [Mycobacterium talmoniae]|uniref:hypothetical protein n=1 Tax=Mycobacterium talmoniae TaxID=1858794 RepID=UPI0010588431|nr:hypothetical protein [Mycobacterium talmoniae]
MLIIATAPFAAMAALVIAALVTVAGADHHAKTRATTRACETALGVPVTPTATISDLAGPQAADVVASTVTGAAAAELLDTLYRIHNWRDLPAAEVNRWAHDPTSENLPEHAILTPAHTTPTGSYETRCAAILDALTEDQKTRAAALPHTDTTPTNAGLRAAVTAESLLNDRSSTGQDFVAAVAKAAYPHDQAPESGLTHLLWCGAPVAPAAAARGDLIFFDYARTGPTHLGVVLDATTVVTTTGLDAPATPPGSLAAGHPPMVNITVIRPDDITDTATTTESPDHP